MNAITNIDGLLAQAERRPRRRPPTPHTVVFPFYRSEQIISMRNQLEARGIAVKKSSWWQDGLAVEFRSDDDAVLAKMLFT